MKRSGPSLVLISDTLARYPHGGGHWAARLQSILGLKALGAEVHWVAPVAHGSGGRSRTEVAADFFRLARLFDFDQTAHLLFYDPKEIPVGFYNLDDVRVDLRSFDEVTLCAEPLRQILARADAAIDYAGTPHWSILEPVRRRIFLDLDPGHLQVGIETGLKLERNNERFYLDRLWRYDNHFTVGLNVGGANCVVPDLGIEWIPLLPPVHLDFWPRSTAAAGAPFSSITHWGWEQLRFNGKPISVSKRLGYLRYVGIPAMSGRPFRLAVNLTDKEFDDREILRSNGWEVVDPRSVCPTPEAYCRFISDSLAEFGCAKPIHAQLRTGWFSDRTAGYLASGRPALVEDTGLPDSLVTGAGLIKFSTYEEAVSGVEAIAADPLKQGRWAREWAEAHLSVEKAFAPLLAILS